MGLDASVGCTCYRDGRVTPPPVPRELISFDDGWLVVPSDVSDEQWWQFEDWMEHACGHRRMEVTSVRVSNWAGYRAFQQALAQAGWERFPTLREELPNANGGSTSALAAARALEELAAFCERTDLGHDWFLVDGETGDLLFTYIAAYDGKIIYDGTSGVDVGFDPRGLFVVSRTQPPRELFRAMRIAQRLLDPARAAAGGGPGPAELVDLDTGRRFACPTAVSGRPIAWPDGRLQDDEGRVRSSYPGRLQVERRAITAADFADVLRPLEEVFQAAVATGNPVRWS